MPSWERPNRWEAEADCAAAGHLAAVLFYPGELHRSRGRDQPGARQLAADAIGGRIATPRELALASDQQCLSYDSAWEMAYAVFARKPNQRPIGVACSQDQSFVRLAGQAARSQDRSAQIRQFEEERLAHPTDTHPPLGIRLKALGSSLEQVFDAALDIPPAAPATG